MEKEWSAFRDSAPFTKCRCAKKFRSVPRTESINMVKPKELAAEINKVLGTGTVLMGNDKSLEVQTIPTGVAPIDFLLKGGVPKGRFTELFGAYSTLKSYVGLRTIAECQKLGGVAAIIDTEHAYEPDWAESLGVDTESLIYQSPQSGEEAIDRDWETAMVRSPT